jgi:hypothetical protein
MHDIVIIKSIKLREEESIEILAIMQNIDYQQEGILSLNRAPDYAPILCQTIVARDELPPWMDLTVFDEAGLEELINRYCLLNDREWKVLATRAIR